MKITNKLNLPSAFVNMAESNYKPTPNQYSATTLLKPTRQIILERRYNDNLEADASEMIWALFGKAVHYILEQHDNSGWAEKKIKFTLDNGITISGIVDLYSELEQRVVDYKTCTTYKVEKEEFDEWKKQLGIYAWVLEKLGFPCRKATIYAIMRDWTPGKTRFKNYPQLPVAEVTFEYTASDFADIEYYLYQKTNELTHAETLADEDLPMCSDEELWRSPSTYHVINYKGKRMNKSKTNNITEAEQFLIDNRHRGAWKVVEKKGTPKKCFSYCNANQFCPYYRELMLGNRKDNEEEGEEGSEI